MRFDKNIALLNESFPEIGRKMYELEERIDKDLIEVISNREGYITLKTNDQYIHDKENPIQQAKKLIQQFTRVKEHSDILFYGIGMGYHITAFVEAYPGTSFSIYEPVPELFYQFLCHADFEQIPLNLLKNIYIENKQEDPNIFCSTYVRGIRSSALIIDLPSYQTVFPEKHKAFLAEFETQINERRNSLNTVAAFEKRWTINSIKNFVQILTSPNLLLERKGYFTNKPAILVAAGPSLEEEIERLKTIKEKGLAYVFSVGTAINTLIQYEFYPDAACTYDPTEDNQIVCKEVQERRIRTIPLIFGSTVGHETLEKYPGPKMHMLLSQDINAAFYLKPKNQKSVETINDATTIAVIALQLLARLGFNPIILVGQNLAFRDRMIYASGSTFHPIEVSAQEVSHSVLVKDVYGNDVASSTTFIRMKQQFEIYLSHFKDLHVINTTQYGAHIEGTRFQSLDEVVECQLQERVVEDSWLESVDCSYDMEYLIKQSHLMNNACEKFVPLLEKCKLDLINIDDLKNCNDPIRIGQSYEQFNLSMDRLRSNKFYETFIMPMNRVELELLMLAVPEISAETDPVLKAQMMEKEFLTYLLKCEGDFSSISTLFQEMNQSIESLYTIYKVKKKSGFTKILLVDCDGVLTDGSIYYSTSGEELRKFNFKDQAGIRRLQERGIQTLIINKEAKLVVEKIASKMGIGTVCADDLKQIIATVLDKYRLDHSEIACILNDMPDMDVFRHIGLSFACGNASKAFRDEVDYVLPVNGGEGVIMKIAELITTNIINVN